MKLPQQAVGCLAIVFFLQLLSFSCSTATYPLTTDPNEAREIAREAYISLTPAVINWRFLATSTSRNGFDNFRHFRVAFFPNDNIIYSTAWLDLRQESRVVIVPPISGRYYSLHIIDGHTHNLGIVSDRTRGDEGGAFAVARASEGECTISSPQEEECASFINGVYCSEGDYVLLLIRIQFFSRLDMLFTVPQLQAGFDILRLSTFCGLPGPSPLPDPEIFSIPLTSSLETLDFFMFANQILPTLDINANEIDDFERFSRIGIKANAPFPPPEFSQQFLLRIQQGILEASAQIDAEIQNFDEGVKMRGWQVLADPPQFGTREEMQDRFLTRAGAARGALYGLDPEEALYEFAREAADGGTLDASNGQAYYILFDPADVPPVSVDPIGYWSLTMHEASTGRFVVNGFRRHSLGSRDLNSLICTYPNGSFPILMQSQRPFSGFDDNWLPAPLTGEFFLVMRLYVPEQSAIELPYLPPGVIRGFPSETPTNCP